MELLKAKGAQGEGGGRVLIDRNLSFSFLSFSLSFSLFHFPFYFFIFHSLFRFFIFHSLFHTLVHTLFSVTLFSLFIFLRALAPKRNPPVLYSRMHGFIFS